MKYLDAYRLADVVRDADAVVVGTGVAGLSAALGLSARRVTVLTKTRLGTSGSSPWAQGGVAAALSADDSPLRHAEDTLAAGAGLCDAAAVATLTEEGPERVRRLIELGARFDRDAAGRLAMGREGAHGRRRILHAGGDRTGAEMVRALVDGVLRRATIDVREHAFATDLVTIDRRVVGVLAREGEDEASRLVFHRAPAVVLATGGFGQLFARTTNPSENTGDGLAMAARAGARLIDLEFVQFHPTALDVALEGEAKGGTLPLVTEALRGEGAILLDAAGHRFMPAIHPRAELAPRDIVARAIWRRQEEGPVTLDARDAVGTAFPDRFPTVFESCRRHGIDPRREPIPVTPAAHYAMAGVVTDRLGRTSLDGLWACGEVSATGVHGANRLASNSLLEALVFGERVARDIASIAAPSTTGPARVARESLAVPADSTTGGAVRETIRRTMWRDVGLVRHGDGLASALETLDRLAEPAPERSSAEPTEVQNLWTVGRLVTSAALVREESRGSHYREDFPSEELIWCRRLAWTYRDWIRDESPSGELPIQKVVDEPLAAPGVERAREIA